MKSPVSMYDALISVQVPGDKARAVAEALESDMSVHLATRQDLLLLRKDVDVLRNDMDVGFVAVRKDMDAGFVAVRKDMDAGFVSVRTEIDVLRRETNAGLAFVRKDMEHLGDRLMIRLATFITVSLGVLFAALRYLP